MPQPLADAENSEHQQAEDQAAGSKEEQLKKKPKKNPNDPKKADEHSELKKTLVALGTLQKKITEGMAVVQKLGKNRYATTLVADVKAQIPIIETHRKKLQRIVANDDPKKELMLKALTECAPDLEQMVEMLKQSKKFL